MNGTSYARWALLVVIATSLASCAGLNKYNSACYFIVFNAVASCIPEDESKMQLELKPKPSLSPANKGE